MVDVFSMLDTRGGSGSSCWNILYPGLRTFCI